MIVFVVWNAWDGAESGALYYEIRNSNGTSC
jgi:hypothetical protein